MLLSIYAMFGIRKDCQLDELLCVPSQNFFVFLVIHRKISDSHCGLMNFSGGKQRVFGC